MVFLVGNLLKKLEVGEHLLLKRETDNSYDEFSVLVLTESNVDIGYIEIDYSEQISKYLKSGLSYDAKVKKIYRKNEYINCIALIDFFEEKDASKKENKTNDADRYIFDNHMPFEEGVLGTDDDFRCQISGLEKSGIYKSNIFQKEKLDILFTHLDNIKVAIDTHSNKPKVLVLSENNLDLGYLSPKSSEKVIPYIKDYRKCIDIYIDEAWFNDNNQLKCRVNIDLQYLTPTEEYHKKYTWINDKNLTIDAELQEKRELRRSQKAEKEQAGCLQAIIVFAVIAFIIYLIV